MNWCRILFERCSDRSHLCTFSEFPPTVQLSHGIKAWKADLRFATCNATNPYLLYARCVWTQSAHTKKSMNPINIVRAEDNQPIMEEQPCVRQCMIKCPASTSSCAARKESTFEVKVELRGARSEQMWRSVNLKKSEDNPAQGRCTTRRCLKRARYISPILNYYSKRRGNRRDVSQSAGGDTLFQLHSGVRGSLMSGLRSKVEEGIKEQSSMLSARGLA